jgi:hypothetical protein
VTRDLVDSAHSAGIYHSEVPMLESIIGCMQVSGSGPAPGGSTMLVVAVGGFAVLGFFSVIAWLMGLR